MRIPVDNFHRDYLFSRGSWSWYWYRFWWSWFQFWIGQAPGPKPGLGPKTGHTCFHCNLRSKALQSISWDTTEVTEDNLSEHAPLPQCRPFSRPLCHEEVLQRQAVGPDDTLTETVRAGSTDQERCRSEVNSSLTFTVWWICSDSWPLAAGLPIIFFIFWSNSECYRSRTGRCDSETFTVFISAGTCGCWAAC